jgi:hypothetical protein
MILGFCFRKGATLSYNQVIEILKLKDRSDGPRLVAPIARKYGVTPKAIRDIWNHATWADLTTAPCVDAAAIIDRRNTSQRSTSQVNLSFDRAHGTYSTDLDASSSAHQPLAACEQEQRWWTTSMAAMAAGAGTRAPFGAANEPKVHCPQAKKP